MKKCIVVSDSFKGTLSSKEICAIARETVARYFPACELLTIPIADGGEGTVECFAEALQAETVKLTVHGPFGEPVEAAYCRKDKLAVIEMAAAAGLPLAGERKNPALASTFGVGELMRHAIEQGAKELLLGLGGSATNDGGCGAAAALGVRFLDTEGQAFVPVGGTLHRIAAIDTSAADALLRPVRVTVMCDVDDPLYGTQGAAYVFAPQKGADAAMVQRLDEELRSFDRALQAFLGVSAASIPGSGAAGGMGAGCLAFFKARLCPGIEMILDAVHFDEQLCDADLVITGEGCIDAQSCHGKVLSGIAKRTGVRNVPLIVLAGRIGAGAEESYALGVSKIYCINEDGSDLAYCRAHAKENYQNTLRKVLSIENPYR